MSHKPRGRKPRIATLRQFAATGYGDLREAAWVLVATQRLRASPVELFTTPPPDRMPERQHVNGGLRWRYIHHARKRPADAGHWPINALRDPRMPLLIMAAVRGWKCRA